jgi:hypothetical protein
MTDSSGFNNPLVGGGGGLVYPSIHSPNFLAGVSGWTIRKDGTVEFNSGTFRGTVTAGKFAGTNFEINANGEFFYSGTPALGNLTQSIVSGAAGFDSYGNNYLAGNTSYGPFAGAFTATQVLQGVITFYQATTEAGPWTATGLIQCPAGAVNGGLLLSVLGNNPGIITLQPFGSGVNTVQVTQPVVFANGIDSPEVWHNLGSPIAGWSVSTARYKMLADSGLVLVQIANLAPPGVPPADGTIIFTVANGFPAAYRTGSIQRMPTSHSAGALTEQTSLLFNTDGSIQVFGVFGTTVNRLDGTFILSTL